MNNSGMERRPAQISRKLLCKIMAIIANRCPDCAAGIRTGNYCAKITLIFTHINFYRRLTFRHLHNVYKSVRKSHETKILERQGKPCTVRIQSDYKYVFQKALVVDI